MITYAVFRQNRKILAVFLFLAITTLDIKAQIPMLDTIQNKELMVLHSRNKNSRANAMAARCTKVMDFIREHFQMELKIKLLVLSEEDWPFYTDFPVYGMPHYKDSGTLIIAADEAAFWTSTLPPLESFSPGQKNAVAATYVVNGKISLQSFFDLLVIHEAGHALLIQGKRHLPKKWMTELFCNMLLHNYVEEKEPHLLPVLTLYPQLVTASANNFLFRDLESFENSYELIATQHPFNYAWYQCHFHSQAARIYRERKQTDILQLWQLFRERKTYPDDELQTMLEQMVPGVGLVMKNWKKIAGKD